MAAELALIVIEQRHQCVRAMLRNQHLCARRDVISEKGGNASVHRFLSKHRRQHDDGFGALRLNQISKTETHAVRVWRCCLPTKEGNIFKPLS